MRRIIVAIGLLLLVGCSTPDPIGVLTKRLNDDIGGLWINGMYPIIHLPSNASTKDVLDEAIKKTGFDEGHIKRYNILNTRTVNLRAGTTHEYSAILIDSDLGRKVILMRYEGETTGWWTRFYDAKQ